MSLKKEGQFLKVSVKTRGCSGNAYSMDWTKERQKLDEEVKVNDSLSLLIDSKALFTIIGSELDYNQGELESGFVFNNPNIKGTCGCGTSFLI